MMNPDFAAGPRWTTSSFANDAHTMPIDMAALCDHLEACRQQTGRLFAIQCGIDALHGFVAPRFVTTLVVAFVLIGTGLSLA